MDLIAPARSALRQIPLLLPASLLGDAVLEKSTSTADRQTSRKFSETVAIIVREKLSDRNVFHFTVSFWSALPQKLCVD